MSVRVVPHDVLRVQVQASDPRLSVWVAANAGSGKTHVLAQRVIRLLLDGVEPARILCITFTKAAAANMANRVYDELRRWTALDDTALDQAIEKISGLVAEPALRALARRLFAIALETPGGLKVQTIHAFCTRLLQQFPFEANVAARFAVLDEAAEAQLLDQVSLTVLLEAASTPMGKLGRAVGTAIASAADQTFKDVVGEAIRKRDVVSAWMQRTGGVEAAIADLCGTLGVRAGETVEEIETKMTEGPLLPAAEWPAVAAALDGGGKDDKRQAERLRAAATLTGKARADLYCELFIQGKGEPRKRVVTRAIDVAEPDLARRLREEQSRLLGLIDQRKALHCRDRTAALLTVADAVICRYRAEKERRGLLDYDDLIGKTLAMLDKGAAAWVHYKLDRGIDHVLIDEAQDTSPRQWDIIRLLTGEFFAGEGARHLKRTIFAVGDEKQSIFSFQGAAPLAFADNRSHFRGAAVSSGLAFVELEFKHSFRSGANVLGAVDHVFRSRAVFSSVTTDADGIPPHIALPDAAPGLVEIWDTIKPEERPEVEPWNAPFDIVTESSVQVRLAQRLARHVAIWMRQGYRPGDVLVLVRQRGGLFESIIRALKDAGIAVAGADRLVLTEHIAVMDLMALADALLLPDDDLALASVLKSPLFGFDDDDLFAIACERSGSLRAALAARVGINPRFAAADAKLARLAERARRAPPFAFLAEVLGPDGGRKQILGRLGHEAADALDELLNLALDYERREAPTLQGFVAWLRSARTDIKRDMEITRDEVRVMTVHGAKGLEAPLVVLADTTTPPAGPPQRQPRLLALPGKTGSAVPSIPRFIWAGAKATDTAGVTEAREHIRREAEDEYRRLLYVAMTRAIDRLIVCGTEGERSPPEGCWYNLVRGEPGGSLIEEIGDDGESTVWRYRKVPATGTPTRAAVPAGITASAEKPPWITRAAPVEPRSEVTLFPSRLSPNEVDAPAAVLTGGMADRRKAMARGELVHRLLQSLPDMPQAARLEAARRHLIRAANAFTAEEREAMAARVIALLDDARFAPLFLPGSRAEVAVVGLIARPPQPPLAVSGQVDRLVVTADAVLIADYKTNRPAPRRIEDVSGGYLRQLALYRAVLMRLYPDRPVRAAVVWTDVPDLMEISPEVLDTALTAVTSA